MHLMDKSSFIIVVLVASTAFLTGNVYACPTDQETLEFESQLKSEFVNHSAQLRTNAEGLTAKLRPCVVVAPPSDSCMDKLKTGAPEFIAIKEEAEKHSEQLEEAQAKTQEWKDSSCTLPGEIWSQLQLASENYQATLQLGTQGIKNTLQTICSYERSWEMCRG